jgi:hypothetical protein
MKRTEKFLTREREKREKVHEKGSREKQGDIEDRGTDDRGKRRKKARTKYREQ